MNTLAQSPVYRFDDFLIDLSAGTIFRVNSGQGRSVVSLGSRAFSILRVLLERRGEFVSKQELMEAVWPNLAVEESNLTVQIAALRRALDVGRQSGSCIQTLPGRGYRLLPPVTPCSDAADGPHTIVATTGLVASSRAARPMDKSDSPIVSRRWPTSAAIVGLLFAAVVLSILAWHASYVSGTTPPRLSVAVMPFENLSGNQVDDNLTEGITDDLTTDLAYLCSSLVTTRASARVYKGRGTDIRQVGRDLNVRYLVEGSVRHIANMLRVDARLVSAESGMHLWTDRFDADPSANLDQVTTRIADRVNRRMVELESARSEHERPNNPDALDLILQARNLQLLPPNQRRNREVLALYERALAADPSSIPAATEVAFFLIDRQPGGAWNSFEDMERADQLLAQAHKLAPDSEAVLNVTVWWLRSTGRCAEAMEAAQRALQMDPNRLRVWTGVANELAVCKTYTGHAEEALLLQKKIDDLNPLSPYRYIRFRHMGFASLMLGRDQDAITYLEQSLVLHADYDGDKEMIYRLLAAAYACSGQLEEATRALTEANRLWPYDTVRSHYPYFALSSNFADQIRHYQDGLRLAGERDHADEDADYGVQSDRILHGRLAAPTPRDAPEVMTIRTPDLVRLIADHQPIILDTVTNSWGWSIPGAVGLRFAGLGGSFSDPAQDHLRSKVLELATGDLHKPIVTVGFNSENFDGRNLALRLVALGYTHVYWYRGGREAWEVSNLPEAKLALAMWY